ncbi:MAG: UDP-N-acetylglucosamine 1-carboxyvinyltransferase, partial [Elusimicrobiota bacterium]|nr:UDP-N-acetylglucosamine 1-carboxyvinyltransferase [Elusimicrobiota bacterium]
TAISILEFFNKKVNFIDGKVIIESTLNKNIPTTAPYELIKKMRASFLVTGPLLARYKTAKVTLPGGCVIGVRPVNFHLDGFALLGANVQLESGYVRLSARKLHATTITLPFQSVGATENLIMASTLAEGKTVIHNAACEPEIVDLVNFLNCIGTNIKYTNDRTIEVLGGKVKSLKGTNGYSIIPDRIEAGTYLIAGAITRGNIIVENCFPEHLRILISKLKQAGASIKVYNIANLGTRINYSLSRPCAKQQSSIEFKVADGRKKLKPVSIVTKPYPGFPTDLQAQWMVLMCTSNGKSTIKETVFENRFLHVAELQRLGAKLQIKDDTVFVEGNSPLTGAPVMVSDLRAGAALVLAGLAAKGKTTISHIYHLERGYEDLVEKLKGLGAKIQIIEE